MFKQNLSINKKYLREKVFHQFTDTYYNKDNLYTY